MPTYFRHCARLLLLFALLICVCCGGGGNEVASPPPPVNSGIQVTIDSSQVFQTWDSWTAVPQGPSIFGITIPPSVLTNIITDLVDAGLTGFRIPLSWRQQAWTVDYANSDTTIDWTKIDFTKTYTIAPDEFFDYLAMDNQMVIPFLNQLAARGITSKNFVTPQFPPANAPSFWTGPNGAAKYGTFALAYVQWLAGNTTLAHPTQPVKVDYWAVLNEPDGQGWPSATVNGFYAAAAPRFANAGLTTKVEVAETVFCNSNYYDAAASGLTTIGVISFHTFDYLIPGPAMPASFACRNTLRSRAQAIGAITGLTEMGSSSNWSARWDVAMGRARDMYWEMTEAGISTWSTTTFYGCRTAGCPMPQGVGNIISLEPDMSKYYKFGQYYSYRQYAHYILPGYRRIGTTCGNCATDPTIGQIVKPVAFLTPSGKVVVVVINDQSGMQNISLLGLPAGTYDITGVDEVNQQAPVTYTTQTIGAGQTLIVAFPAQAILTFVQR
jgi:glycosyl hydrolase family 30